MPVNRQNKQSRARRDDELRAFGEDPKIEIFVKEVNCSPQPLCCRVLNASLLQVQEFYGISADVACKHLLASSAGCRRMCIHPQRHY